ncbi:SAM-dependent methyltransferase [Lutibacter sp. B2]|nr:SAM-dependent methyltransferase [Lutibacter sp. B2]
MHTIQELINKIIEEDGLIHSVLSNVRKKDEQGYNKVIIRPILLKDTLLYQFEYHYKKKVVHENLKQEATANKMNELLENEFRQGQLYGTDHDYQILISKKFKAKIIKKPASKKMETRTHNRKKKYIIEENVPCPFLTRLGVMNKDGKVISAKYDKFRQINRFLEMIRDVVSNMDHTKEIKIIDFGCGKSYLTFAMYYYLVDLLGYSVDIIGLDLKEEVIKDCNQIARDLEYDHLRFQMGDIAEFEGVTNVDMVVTLHACDTATDAALAKAVNWNAKVILSVPCCQHELFNQIENEMMSPMLKHGIIKERLSALTTDSIRANILEIMGYSTQILEFIDTEHTPKNLLIRAVKSDDKNEKAMDEYLRFKEFLGVDPYLERALRNELLEKGLKL